MVKFILIITVLWRISLFLIAYLGGKILPFIPRFPYADIFLIPSGLPKWFWSFANFDGVHYLTIAKNGYTAQFTQVFFPLYPLIIRFIGNFLSFLDPVVIGVMLSTVFFMLALFRFYQLLSLDYSDKQIIWMFLFLMLFPTSLYFGSIYTESLFLFLVLSAFWQARRGRFAWAAIFGALASATKLIGILILPALLWEQYHYNIKNQKSKIKNTKNNVKLSNIHRLIFHFPFSIFHSPITYIVPLGLISYMLYLKFAFNDPLYFWHAQPVFGAERSGQQIILLPQVIFRYLKMFVSLNLYSETFFIVFLEFFSTFFSIILLILAHIKRVRLSYLIFSWLAIILPTLTGTLSSMPRYILVVFPMFIVLGLTGNKFLRNLLFIVYCLLFIVLTILFTAGHWVA